MPKKLTCLTFGFDFNQGIELNTLPKSITTLTFGDKFNQKIEPNILPKELTFLTFGFDFNQKIEPNILPEKLTNLTFSNLNQKIDSNILPSNLKHIEFKWFIIPINSSGNIEMASNIEMVNNIPGYYDVKIFLLYNILSDNDIKWPIHVCDFEKTRWSSEVYEVIDNYDHSSYGNITVLINKKSFQPYSSAKSTLK